MSVPVIQSVEVLYPAGRNYLLPGETAQVTAVVVDPTGSTAEVTVTVTDAAGGVGTGLAVISLNDQLTTTAELREMDYDAGWDISPAVDHVSRWFVTAPAGA